MVQTRSGQAVPVVVERHVTQARKVERWTMSQTTTTTTVSGGGGVIAFGSGRIDPVTSHTRVDVRSERHSRVVYDTGAGLRTIERTWDIPVIEGEPFTLITCDVGAGPAEVAVGAVGADGWRWLLYPQELTERAGYHTRTWLPTALLVSLVVAIAALLGMLFFGTAADSIRDSIDTGENGSAPETYWRVWWVMVAVYVAAVLAGVGWLVRTFGPEPGRGHASMRPSQLKELHRSIERKVEAAIRPS